MIRRIRKDYIQDCYFCLVNIKGFGAKHRMKVACPNVDSARRYVSHDPLMRASLPSEDDLVALADEFEEDCDEESAPAHGDSTDSEYDPQESLKPILCYQERLNDLIRDLVLSKQKAELLASRLQEND